MNGNVPDPSVRRLSAYLRQLENLSSKGVKNVSSRQLAEYMKVGQSQVRRDLTLFGQFGRPGLGYKVDELINQLRDILGTQKKWKVIIVGAGELCHALLSYAGFAERGFDLIAAFDVDPEKIGKKVGSGEVHHMNELEKVISENDIHIAVISVPGSQAQKVADRLVAAGIEGILNFAPADIEIPDNVHVNHVDITSHLEQISFQLSHEAPEV